MPNAPWPSPRDALREVDPVADPVTAGLIHERVARYLWQIGSGPEGVIENEMAVALVPSEPVSEARAVVVAALGQQLMVAGRNDEAIRWCQQAIELAGEVGARAVEGHAVELARHCARQLRARERRARPAPSRRGAGAGDAVVDRSRGRAAVNESGILESIGQLEAAAALASAAAADAVQHGLERSNGNFLRLNAIECLLELGRYDEAEAILERIDRTRPLGIDDLRRLESWAALHMGRGDLDAAAATMAQLRSAVASARNASSFCCVNARSSSRSQPETTVAYSGSSTTVPSGNSAGLSHCSRRPQRPRPIVPTKPAAAPTARVSRMRCARRGTVSTSSSAFAMSRPNPSRPRPDSSRSSRVSVRGPRGRTIPIRGSRRPRCGAVRIGSTGSRTRGFARPTRSFGRVPEHWRRAHRSPRPGPWRRRSAPVSCSNRSTALAPRRGRVDIGAESGASDGAVDRFRLTEREREVLNLVAKGRTNPQIAAALFISAKTASVHVSNILTKLGVANRGEAAAEARRLGLD